VISKASPDRNRVEQRTVYERSPKMRHYAQESGRAGRDSEVSEAIIMRLCRGTQRAALQDRELRGGWDTGLQVDVVANVFAHPPRNSNDLQV
jgi:hypothetical protein